MAEFDPIPDPPTPEEKAAEQAQAILGNLQLCALAGIAAAGQCARMMLDLVSKDSHHVERLGGLAASASAALELTERAQKMLGLVKVSPNEQGARATAVTPENS